MDSCASVRLKKYRRKNKNKTKEVVVTNVATSPEIFEELLIEILVRVPVKSLMRFKCVSKLWLSLITSRYLSNLFLKTSPRSRFTAYLVNPIKESEYLLLTSSNYDYSNTSLSVTLDQDLSMPALKGGNFVSYVRGLVCFRKFGRVQVCNLSTRQVIELPQIKGSYSENQMWCCLGHDPVNDEYKVLGIVWEVSKDKVITSRNQVLTLGYGASWRKIRNHIPHHPFSHYSKGLIINGVLYYRGLTDGAKCVVMSFDFSSEEFNMFEMPTTIHAFHHLSYVDLMVYKGKLAVFDCFKILIAVWVLEEDGEKKSHHWSNKIIFVLPLNRMNFCIMDMLKMGSTGRSGELWFTNEDLSRIQPSFFYGYNFERYNKITRIETRPLLNNFTLSLEMLATFWDNVESVMYLET